MLQRALQGAARRPRTACPPSLCPSIFAARPALLAGLASRRVEHLARWSSSGPGSEYGSERWIQSAAGREGVVEEEEGGEAQAGGNASAEAFITSNLPTQRQPKASSAAPTLASLACSVYFSHFSDLNPRERAFCARFFASYTTLLFPPTLPLSNSRLARAKNAYGGKVLDVQRLLRQVVLVSARPTEEMMILERIWSAAEAGMGGEIGKDGVGRVREMLREGVDEYEVTEEACERVDAALKAAVDQYWSERP